MVDSKVLLRSVGYALKNADFERACKKNLKINK